MSHVAELEAWVAMAIAKHGEPTDQWTQTRGRPHSVSQAFGLVDADGATITGLTVEFIVYTGKQVKHNKYIFTLWRQDLGGLDRVYQQEIVHRAGLRPTDHAYSHEHIGDRRDTAIPAWGALNFRDAVERFCTRCNLTLTETLPDPDAFSLR